MYTMVVEGIERKLERCEDQQQAQALVDELEEFEYELSTTEQEREKDYKEMRREHLESMGALDG